MRTCARSRRACGRRPLTKSSFRGWPSCCNARWARALATPLRPAHTAAPCEPNWPSWDPMGPHGTPCDPVLPRVAPCDLT
eukprot:4699254-Prymnesium_polylepis.1